MAFYCDHGRTADGCEDCVFLAAQERGTVGQRRDLLDRGAKRAPGLTTDAAVEPLVADKDVVIADEGSDVDRGTFVAKGTVVPVALRDRMPKRAASKPKGSPPAVA